MNTSRKQNRNQMMWKGLAVVSLLLLLITSVAFLSSQQDDTVATVDGVKISKDQLYTALVDYEGQKILEKLILEELIKKESKKTGITVTESEFQASFDKVRNAYATEDEFQENLKKDGYTEQSLRTELRTQLYIRKLLEPRITVDENDVKAHYAEHTSHDTGSNTKSESEVVADIREELVNQEILELMEPWFEELRSRADIKVSLPGLQLISPKEETKQQ